MHDLFGKPVSTFPDHARRSARSLLPGWSELTGSSVLPSPRKPGLELSVGVRSLTQEPWWNADRRACPLPILPRKRGRGKRKGARRIARCGGWTHVCRRSASFFLSRCSPISLRFIRACTSTANGWCVFRRFASLFSGGKRFVPLRCKARTQPRRENEIVFRPRDSGGARHTKCGGAGVGGGDLLAPTETSSGSAPLPPRYARSPLPAFAGRDESCASVA